MRTREWFSNIGNLVALLSIAIIIANLVLWRDPLVFFLSFGTLILMVFLRYADMARFRVAISQQEIPPLGIAKGSVRAILAFTILVGFGLYIYNVATGSIALSDKIFTALISILSAVVGFYFGTRSTTVPSQTISVSPAPTVTGLEPSKGEKGHKIKIANLAGTGFVSDATVCLEKNAGKIIAQEVQVVQSTKITCSFDLSAAEEGDWDVVVTNPDNRSGTLPEGFEIVGGKN